MSWWNRAQHYERNHTIGYVREYGEEIRRRPGDLSPDFFPSADLREKVTEWATGRICLEVGPSVCPSINGLLKAKQVIVVEPMANQFRKYIWMPPNGVLISKSGEEALPAFAGKVDGIIVDRNCIDHAEDPLWLFNHILDCAAPGCWVLHWSDIWHLNGVDDGHRNITKDPNVLREFVTFRQFDIVHEFTNRTPGTDGLLDWGCVARKKGGVT